METERMCAVLVGMPDVSSIVTTASHHSPRRLVDRRRVDGRRRVKVRDLPMADRLVVLVWAKRLWRCGGAGLCNGTWSEESDEIAPRAVLTERARAEIARLPSAGQILSRVELLQRGSGPGKFGSGREVRFQAGTLGVVEPISSLQGEEPGSDHLGRNTGVTPGG